MESGLRNQDLGLATEVNNSIVFKKGGGNFLTAKWFFYRNIFEMNELNKNEMPDFPPWSSRFLPDSPFLEAERRQKRLL